MTTKQMADVAGVSVDTIARKAKELFPAKMEARKKTVFAEKEAIEIIKSVRKKNMVELPQNAAELPQNAEVSRAMLIMAEAMDRMTKVMEKMVEKIIPESIQPRPALPEAPKLTPRDRINMIVREYATKAGKTYQEAWGTLYKDFSYRTHQNVTVCASRQNMPTLDYIEIEGQLETLEAVARDLFGAV